jgi:hypothetical protein
MPGANTGGASGPSSGPAGPRWRASGAAVYRDQRQVEVLLERNTRPPENPVPPGNPGGSQTEAHALSWNSLLYTTITSDQPFDQTQTLCSAEREVTGPHPVALPARRLPDSHAVLTRPPTFAKTPKAPRAGHRLRQTGRLTPSPRPCSIQTESPGRAAWQCPIRLRVERGGTAACMFLVPAHRGPCAQAGPPSATTSLSRACASGTRRGPPRCCRRS